MVELQQTQCNSEKTHLLDRNLTMCWYSLRKIMYQWEE